MSLFPSEDEQKEKITGAEDIAQISPSVIRARLGLPDPVEPTEPQQDDAVRRQEPNSTENDTETEETIATEPETAQTATQATATAVPVSEVPKINFKITDGNLGAGGQKTKYAANVAAIRTLQLIEGENRTAAPEEQETLSRYVGWGGLPQAFDSENESWKKEYEELKNLLNEEEYASARASTLNAHYTSPVVIKAMYATLERMGFQSGNILEPAMGTGNFFGLLPETMKGSQLYGVELDSVTGRIGRQLYPNATVTVSGFEKTSYPDNFFDMAVGNVPFGNYKVTDPRYDKNNFLIHDYFFAKTLDQVRPGACAYASPGCTLRLVAIRCL